MGTNNYTVGQKLWFVPSHDRYTQPYEMTIKAVGRKWLTCGQYRIDKETLKADGGKYNSPGKAYLSREEYEDMLAVQAAWRGFIKPLSVQNPPSGVTLEKIEQAKMLLFGEAKS